MALPRKYLAEKSSGSEFKLLSTADLSPTAAVVGPGSSTPGDFAIWGGFDGKTLIDGVVQTAPAGALDGNGTATDPLAVRVDGTTVTINASNELEASGVSAGIVTSPTGALDGDGTAPSPLAVRVDGVTVQINASNELESTGVGGTVVVSDALAGIGTGGDPVRVLVDNETIGINTDNALEVLKAVLVSGGPGDARNLSFIPVANALPGSVLPVSNGGAIWTTVVAAADQDIASNTTPANDNELFFTMVANKVYEFDALIMYVAVAGGATPDFKYQFNGPATLTGGWFTNVHALSTSDAGATTGNTTSLPSAQTAGTAATPRVIRVFGWAYSTGGGVGSAGFIFQWSQNTSGANPTTRLAGSLLQYRKLTP